MDAEQRHACLVALADECVALRNNGRSVEAVCLIGRVVRYTFTDGRRVRRQLAPEFFSQIEQPRY